MFRLILTITIMRNSLRQPQYTSESHENSGYDDHHRQIGYDQDDGISKKGDDTPQLAGSDIEKVDTRHEGDVLTPAMAEGSSYKVLNRWQASLIYITNQVGIGILSLPTAMQTLGLIPGIICIIGMGKLIDWVHL